MTKILVAADWHGNGPWAKRVIDVAFGLGIKTIFQVGDFGIWPGRKGKEYLLNLSRYLVRKKIILIVILGNHEDWNQVDSWRDLPRNENGHLEIEPNIFISDKANVWTQNGKRFGVAAGAYSIDRQYRKLNVDWWPQEQFTKADLHDLEIASGGERVDYMFTHDAPTSIPLNGLKPDIESALHRGMMNLAGALLRPRVWFHGHYHRFTGEYGFLHQLGHASVYGLAPDDNASYEFDRKKLMKQHVAILEIETGEVTFLE